MPMIFLFQKLLLWSMPKNTIDIELHLADKQWLPVEWRYLNNRCLRIRSLCLLTFLKLNIFLCFFGESISLNDEADDVPSGKPSFHSKLLPYLKTQQSFKNAKQCFISACDINNLKKQKNFKKEFFYIALLMIPPSLLITPDLYWRQKKFFFCVKCPMFTKSGFFFSSENFKAKLIKKK